MIRFIIISLVLLLPCALSSQVYHNFIATLGPPASTEVQTPDDLTGVLGWFESDNETLKTGAVAASDGDTLVTWGDHSTNGNDLTGQSTNPPVLDAVTTYLNNSPAITLSGGGFSSTAFTFSGGEAFTLIFIRRSTEAVERFTHGENNGAIVGMSRDAIVLQNGANTIQTADTADYFQTPRLIYAIFNGASSEIYVNRTQEATGDLGSHQVNSTFYVDDWSTAAGSDGQSFLFIICSGVVPSNELAELYTNYIQPKYGNFNSP